MRNSRAALLAPLALAALALTGCAGAAPGGTNGENPGTAQNPGSGGGTKGHATVTVDGQSWEYDSFLCAVGYESTDSEEYSFSATSFTTKDGEKMQFLIDVIDESGQNRVSGDGVEYRIELFDTSNYEDPAVDINAFGTTGVVISGESVKISGTFDNRGESVSIEADVVCNH